MAGLLAGTTGPAVAEQPASRAGQPATVSATDSTTEIGAASEGEALVEARRTGEPVEVLSLRGESSDVFAQPDGSLEAREYLRPVRARVDGEWRAIDTALAPTGDGMVAPAVATVDLAFSGGGTDDPLVRMSRAGRSLELHWPGALPVPELDGTEAVYRDVLPDVDLRMGAAPEGFIQLLVVNTEDAAHSEALSELVLGLDAQGMDVEVTSDGGVAAIDEGAGNAVFEAPAPLMWDSSTGAAAQAMARTTEVDELDGPIEPAVGDSGRQGRVGVEVTDTALSLTPDPEILRGADTQYPVYIDPQWYSPRATSWTMVSRYWSSSPQWKFNGENNAGMGFCGWAYCQPQDLKRLFYQFPTSRYAGTEIVEAEFVVRNVWSASCTARDVEVWRTNGINSGTTWNTQTASGFWSEHLDTRSFAYGYEGCGARDAEFDIRDAVQDAADRAWSQLTLGVRAPASQESDEYTWKRFADSAYIRVLYNRPPPQIRTSQLKMEYGGPCQPSNSPAQVRTRGQVYATNVTDPDGDRVAVQFRAFWDTGDGQGNVVRWNSGLTSDKASGSSFAVDLPSNLPRDGRVGWEARTYDGEHYSPWSSSGSPQLCHFVYNTSVPAAPTVSSPEYPASNPADPNDPWRDGVGKYGNFTFDSTATDVTQYRYRFASGDQATAYQDVSTTGGAARTVRLLPDQPGDNVLYVRALDTAGNASEERTYIFRVRAGTPERMVWGLDEQAGATAAQGEGEPWPAPLTGDAGLGGEGMSGTGLHLGGTSGHARTVTPVLDTSKSFTVSLWARLPESGITTTGTAASQAANNTDAFRLSVDPGTGGWSFNLSNSDASSAPVARVRQNTAAPLGRWTHVAGVVRFPTSEIVLYVDGQRIGSASLNFTGWEARGATAIGARLAGSTASQFFNGDLDEVRFHDYGLSDSQVSALAEQLPISSDGRPALAVWSFEEAAGATSVEGHGQAVQAAAGSGVTFGAEGVIGRAASFDGTTNGVAATTQPVLDTYQSFAVAAWVNLPSDKPNQTMVVAAQTADVDWGFALVHAPNGRGWSMRRWTAGDGTGTLVQASESPCASTSPNCAAAGLGTWTHVVGVHDLDAGQLRIYVNGELAGSAPFTDRWNADGRFTIGAADHHTDGLIVPLEGQIDDLRVFDRVTSTEEVRQLFTQSPRITGRWQFETTTSGTTPDASASANPLALGGGAEIGPGWVDYNSLTLDGVDDYASTDTLPIDTSRSFSVTGWAQAAAAPSGGATVVSSPGTNNSAFSVRFQPDAELEGWGQYQIVLPDADTTGASVIRIGNSQFLDVRDWNHLALVYDGFRRQARLYVNGLLQEVACLDENSDSCGSVSWAENVVTFQANQSLQVGRARSGSTWHEYWPGAIDDLWAFQGALTGDQVAWLASRFSDIPTELPNPR
ncbi:LamG domain-containing protein [Streptomyces sp. 8K308]|nr:LamG domain-containing protein [Streptomyces sp. 8K308]